MVAWRRLGGALASSAAVLVLAGCANAEPGVVAYVGDDRITQGELDTALGGLSSTLQEGQRVNRDAVVNAMIQGSIAEQIATDRNIRVTDAERDELLRTSELAGLLDEPAAKALAYDFADSNLVAQKLGAQGYLDAVKATPVTLNPRFGVLDPENQTITSVEETGSLSTPAALPVEAP